MVLRVVVDVGCGYEYGLGHGWVREGDSAYDVPLHLGQYLVLHLRHCRLRNGEAVGFGEGSLDGALCVRREYPGLVID